MTAEPMDTTRSHMHEFTIEASPEAVWKAITDPGELANWFPLRAEAKPGAGGAITYDWGPDIISVCRIESWEPPHHLRTSWGESAPTAQATDQERQRLAVDWFVEGKGGRTALRLVHSGFGYDANWDEEFDGTRRGWSYELRSLKHYMERHPGRKRHAFFLRQPVKLDPSEVWDRFWGPGGFLREGKLESLAMGDRYRFVLVSGDVVEGEVRLLLPPMDFAGTVENHNDGLLRIGFDKCAGGPEATIWLSTWDVPEADVAALGARWKETLAKTFA